MNSALAAFVEGKAKSATWWHRDAPGPDDAMKPDPDMPPRELRTQVPNDRVPTSYQTPGERMENPDQAGYLDPNQRQTSTHDNAEPKVGLPRYSPIAKDGEDSTSEPVGESRPILESRNVSADSTNTMSPLPPLHPKADSHESDLPERIRATAARAASLIQKGVGADGVMFLDATVGSAGSLIDSTQGLSQTETETDGSKISDTGFQQVKPEPDQSQERDHVPVKMVLEAAKDSVLLGSAYSTAIEDRVRSAIEQAKFSEKVLKSLLRRYPNGQVWHFNAEGDASDEDDSSIENPGSATEAASGSEADVGPTTPTRKRASRRARTRKRDGRAIQSIFPGIRSLVFLGMWDPHQDRWFGASISVSYSSMRIFSVQNELSYIAAFCDVVLAEIWRLEAQELGRSKNDFVSSISHELRSPLHGILGSAECLEEQELSSLSTELIRSITSCGNTLLDVVNDLLEFSRLNHGTQNRRTQNRRKLQVSGPPSTHSDTSATASDIDADVELDGESGSMIDVLTEDAVNTACLGFDHQSLQLKTSGGADNNHFATLILNIEDAQHPDWLFSIASGSWKRICINLVSNALKYTPSGYIYITLRKKLSHLKLGKERHGLVELIVEDSGIGMSNEFQIKSLFRPFRQENNLTPGTGLGLNLVAQIVKSQGGTVQVRSNRGRGTTVKVSLPLRPLASTPPAQSRASSLDLTSPPASVGFFGFGTMEVDPAAEPTKAKANRRLLSTMKRYCMQLGLPVYAADDNINSNASIHIVSEQALKHLSLAKEEDVRRSLLSADSLRTPMIIICSTRDSALKLRSGPLGCSLPHRTQYLWLPVGPAKLATALSACRTYHEQVNVETTEDTDADVNLAGVCKGAEADAVAMEGATLGPPDATEEQAGRTEPPSFRDISLSLLKDEDKGAGIVSPVLPIDDAVKASMLQVPRSSVGRTGSDVTEKSITSALPLRAQINRASTTPAVTTQTFSLLLVDDNVSLLFLVENLSPVDNETGYQSPPSRGVCQERRACLSNSAKRPRGCGHLRTSRKSRASH
jgi:signal transduction histidine kinase